MMVKQLIEVPTRWLASETKPYRPEFIENGDKEERYQKHGICSLGL